MEQPEQSARKDHKVSPAQQGNRDRWDRKAQLDLKAHKGRRATPLNYLTV